MSAGVCEKFLYRGVFISVLVHATGSWAIGATLATLGFAFAHSYQNAIGAVRAGLLGATLLLPVALTHSLWPGIVAHAGIDILSAFVLAPLRRRWGLLELPEAV